MLPLEHAELCQVELADDGGKQQLDDFIRETLNDAETTVMARLAACKTFSSDARPTLLTSTVDFKYATTSTYSPVESEFHIVSGK